MPKGIYQVPKAYNEPVLSYEPGSKEKADLQVALKKAKSETQEIALKIGGKEVITGNLQEMRPPHELSHSLGQYHKGDGSHVGQAIDAAMAAKADWANLSWEHRASIFLKAADLLSGPYRQIMNAATMLGQSKNAYQSEIDAVAEYADFLRFNVEYMTDIYAQQPNSAKGMWNRLEQRPLEGFVLAVTPFNFTSIAGNLPSAPALMGNTAVWKPSSTQVYSAKVIMDIFEEAGLPDGVINMVMAGGSDVGDTCFTHRDFGGIHFTGSTRTFNHMWKMIGENVSNYKSYPRIVGETGGKDFVIAHNSANAKQLATGLVRGAFEFQGQKCSAASRAYVPSNLWPDVQKYMQEDLANIKMGTVEDFSNFVNAVIDEKSFDKISGYIANAKNDSSVKIVAGGNYDKSEGYFIEPTVLVVDDPSYVTMCDELFGPVLTIYVYDENKFEETLKIVDSTSPYALTGAIFSTDRYAAELATKMLNQSAGNFYINDKPTGAVVGQQPFGGARASGTNDKAGSALNLMRWVSPRTIKETFVTPTDYRYPFLGES